MPAMTGTRSWPIRRILLIGSTLAGGIGAAFGSWLLRDADQWWSAMLANIAVVLLLLAPGEYLLVRFRSSFDRIEKATDQAQATAESARRTAEKTARSLDDVRQTLLDRQVKEYESEMDAYREITRNLSRETLVRGLRHATDVGVITPAGVRSPIWETHLHYRYVVGEPDTLVVRIEDDSGEIISSHRWEPDTSAEDFYQQLVQAVREAGHDLGVGLNDPTESVERLSEMLVEVTRLRSQELLGYRYALREIIERIDGWYFTEENVIPADDLRYYIGVERLDEMDWEDHLHRKGWAGAYTALSFARRLYGQLGRIK